MNLTSVCDEILPNLLNHEFGIPLMWLLTTESQPELEKLYYETNANLSERLDELVYLNKTVELQKMSDEAIDELYEELLNKDQLRDIDEDKLEQFLLDQSQMKRQTLLQDFFPAALPILRAIHINNGSLTESEFVILNNLKKLYSRYNDHPANVKKLVTEYNLSIDLIDKRLNLMAEIEHLLKGDLALRMNEVSELGNEYKRAQLGLLNPEKTGIADKVETVKIELTKSLQSIGKKLRTISALCDLIPQLVLCHPSNWYNDQSLREIMFRCQNVSDSIPDLAIFDKLERLELEDLLKIDVSSFIIKS